MKTNLLCLAFLAILFLNCTSETKTNEISGEYSYKNDGLPNFIVSKTDDAYSIKYMTTSGNWSKPKEFVPVDKNTIYDIFGTKKGELIIYGYVWEGKKPKSFYDRKQKKIYIFNVVQDKDSELFSSGFIYRKENDLGSFTEKLYKL